MINFTIILKYLKFVKKINVFLLFALVVGFYHFAFASDDIKNIGLDAKKNQYLVVAGGLIEGNYNILASEICKILNKNSKIKCFTQTTSGSIQNLALSRSGKIEIGISQNDWLYYSYKGDGIFKDIQRDKSLKIIANLYTESLYIIVRKDSNINNFEEIRGKSISVGISNSNTRIMVEKLFEAANFSKIDLQNKYELRPNEERQMFCDSQLDVMFILSTNFNKVTQELLNYCNAKLISIPKEYVSKTIEQNSFYNSSLIGDNKVGYIQTIGIDSSIFTTDRLSENIVYEITKTIFKNSSSIQNLSPVFEDIFSNNFYDYKSLIPFHSGALKFYKELSDKKIDKKNLGKKQHLKHKITRGKI
jgi:TRAP transporter TAXI family solute receptor